MHVLTPKMRARKEEMTKWMLEWRLAIASTLKLLLGFSSMYAVGSLIDNTPASPLETGGILTLLLTGGLTLRQGVKAWRRGEESLLYRSSSQELEARERMRELGLKGRPYPVYFWELTPSDEPDKGDVKLTVMRLERDPTDYGWCLPGYSVCDASGTSITVVEDTDGDNEPEITSLPVTPQYLRPDPDDPEMEGLVNLEDQETLARVQSWVNQLNADAQAEYKRQQKGLPALQALADASPAEQRLSQLRQIQRKAHA